jgi:serine O-acetyltransferase
MENLEQILARFLEKQIDLLIKNHIDNGIYTEEEVNEIKNSLFEATKDVEILELIRGDIEALLKTDPALNKREDKREVLLYPSIKARFFHQVAHKFYIQEKYSSARLISESAKAVTNIEIHPGAKIGKRLAIDHGMGIVIGETAEIGDDVIMFHGVTLGGIGKGGGVKRHPTIGNSVLIGTHSQILGDITVGNNAKIGAHSMVLRNVEENSTVAGVLASVKKRYKNKKSNKFIYFIKSLLHLVRR